MRKAWDAAKKIVLSTGNGGYSVDIVRKLFGMTYHDVLVSASPLRVIEKIEEFEKEQEQEQEQSKKRCENCDHYCGDDNKFKCDIKGVLCIERDRWTPKKDSPETNVESIENRDKIVKALAGLLAAYGEQLWDVVADMQKNP